LAPFHRAGVYGEHNLSTLPQVDGRSQEGCTPLNNRNIVIFAAKFTLSQSTLIDS
jgi:hypothetical protein